MRPPQKAPELGVGTIWWPELDVLCQPHEGLVQVIEAEPETFWTPCQEPSRGFTSRLPPILRHLPQPKLLHGVGAPFGGSVQPPNGHMDTLTNDVAALQPAWISDHLSFNRFASSSYAEPVSTGFFLPPAQCPEGIALAAQHITARRDQTGVPVAFEVPVSYLPARQDEIPDGAFTAHVAEAAGCGILLDLHNLLCNERNGRQTVRAFCESIPLDRVWEIHLAGGQFERGFWLDAHSGLVEPALLEIVADLVPRLPSLGAIIFEIMPDFIAQTGLQAIAALLGQLNDIWTKRGRYPDKYQAPIPDLSRPSMVRPEDWEAFLGATITDTVPPRLQPALAAWIHTAGPGLELYQFLAREGRASSLVFTAPRTIRALLANLGEPRTRDLLARFWLQSPPAYTSLEEARAFLDFLKSACPSITISGAEIASDRTTLQQMR